MDVPLDGEKLAGEPLTLSRALNVCDGGEQLLVGAQSFIQNCREFSSYSPVKILDFNTGNSLNILSFAHEIEKIFLSGASKFYLFP